MRLSRWILIVFQMLWLNVVLPGHTRGAITAPGGEKATSSCCESHSSSSNDHKKTPSEKDKQRCAMCFFVAGLTIAPPVVFWQPLVEETIERHILLQTQLESQHFFSTRHGRDPPSA